MAPKRAALAEANRKLSEANKKLSTIRARVKELQDRVASLENSLMQARQLNSTVRSLVFILFISAISSFHSDFCTVNCVTYWQLGGSMSRLDLLNNLW